MGTAGASGRPGGALFLVCLETVRAEPSLALQRRLAVWQARHCLDRCWLIEANTTSRIVYDSIAAVITDRDRILVTELADDALSFNLRAGSDRPVGALVRRAYFTRY
jgi:hypothetical protein